MIRDLTETGLMDALYERLSRLFKGYTLMNKAGVLQEVRIFRQYLPLPSGLAEDEEGAGFGQLDGTLSSYSDEDYESNFPCIIIKYGEHTDTEERRIMQGLTGIKLLAGVYDESPECSGWRDILNMYQEIRGEFLPDRILKQAFKLEMPLKMRLPESDSWPVYFGEMDMIFSTGRPVMGKDFVTKGAIKYD